MVHPEFPLSVKRIPGVFGQDLFFKRGSFPGDCQILLIQIPQAFATCEALRNPQFTAFLLYLDQ